VRVMFSARHNHLTEEARGDQPIHEGLGAYCVPSVGTERGTPHPKPHIHPSGMVPERSERVKMAGKWGIASNRAGVFSFHFNVLYIDRI